MVVNKLTRVRTAGLLPATLLGLASLLTQCQEKKPDFYRDLTQERDVWRLPIVAPYELLTSVPKGSDRWIFQHADFGDVFSPDSLNLSGGYLTFHDFTKASYGYCDLKRKRLVHMGGFAEFVDSARARHFSARLYPTESVYTCWRATAQLPWAPEILAGQGCGRPVPASQHP